VATHLLGFNPRPFSTAAVSTVLVIAATTVLTTPQARAGFISQVPDAAAYAILYEGTGGHTLHITNVTVNGNIGVGGTGLVSDSGPSTVNGRLDFSASNTGQYGSAPGDTGPTSVNYSVGAVTNALTEVNNLSASLSGLGSSLTS
jgi:hypothetical protein